MSDPLDLGLFPLDLVLLPGEKAPLHLFEPRYRQLYADCTLENVPFVVVHGGLTGTAEVGCSARFESLIRRFEDGRLNVIVQGIAPVRLVEETEGRLYFSALVEELEDASATPAPGLVDDVLTRFRALAGLAEGEMPEAPDGVPLSYAVAGAFELPLEAKQRLLESRDEAERLAMVAELLVAVDKEIEHARMAAHRAGTNGRVFDAVTPAAAAAPGLAAGYARLRGGEPVAVRGGAALIWVEGPDAGSFLHGLLSNDVAALAAGSVCPALLLDAKGHVRADMRVRNDGEGAYTVMVDPALAEEVAGALHRYHFSEDLEILGPEAVELLTVGGGAAVPEGLARISVPGTVPGTRDIVVDDAAAALAALGVEEAPAEALELARIAAGVPRVGVDTGPATLVQEAGLEGTAVSFDKGCYLGQETVARIAFRGRVNRTLRGVALGAPASAGAALTHGGRGVGRLTSAGVAPDLGPIGLAIVRAEVPPGGEVVVEGSSAPGRVVPLPFAAR